MQRSVLVIVSCIIVACLWISISHNCKDQPSIKGVSIDDWQSEVLHDVIRKKLTTIGDFLVTGLGEKKVAALVTNKFSCTSLRPEKLQNVFSSDFLDVFRWDKVSLRKRHFGSAGLLAALAKLQVAQSKVRVDWKVSKISLGKVVTSTVVLQYVSKDDSVQVAQNAVWHCVWKSTSDLQLVSIVTSYLNDGIL